MPTRKEIEEQIAALQAQADEADANDYACEVVDDSGRSTRLTGKHAKSWLQRVGIVDADKSPTSDDDDDDDGKPDPKPKKTGSKFFD